jgi:hypothetical protein
MTNNGISHISDGSIRQESRNRSAFSEEGPMPDSEASAIRTLDAARELGPKIRSAADEIEQGRRFADAFGARDAAGGHISYGDAAGVRRLGTGLSYSGARD